MDVHEVKQHYSHFQSNKGEPFQRYNWVDECVHVVLNNQPNQQFIFLMAALLSCEIINQFLLKNTAQTFSHVYCTLF